jgi:hypothetical protein
VTESLAVTEPGVYEMDADTYHADPVPGGSLSSSGARKLLSPSCPALFDYERKHGQGHKTTWDIGHAAHKLVLGNGPDLVPIEGDYRNKANKERRDQAYLDGAVPLKTDEFDMVHEMAEAIRNHKVASALFNPLGGRAEQSLFWKDTATGVQRRARLDWLPFPHAGRLIVPDYKTTKDASPEGIQKTAHQFGYHQQAPWYLDGITALDLGPDPAFVFVFQEKTPPYLVTVVELDVIAMKYGRYLNEQAIDIYAECTRTGHWPGYSEEIELIPLPGYIENRFLQETSS